MAAFSREPDAVGEVSWSPSSAPGLSVKTWYKYNGDIHGSKIPVVVCHGGPGMPHNYMLSLLDLMPGDRPVIFHEYALFTLSQIGYTNTILGQSWGGYLNQAYACEYPTEFHGLIMSSGLQACSEATESIRARIRTLPKEMQEAIYKAEETGDFEEPAYKAAVQEYYKRHVCRLNPPPEDVQYALDVWSTQTTVYNAMIGPSDLSIISPFKDESMVKDAHKDRLSVSHCLGLLRRAGRMSRD
ncbi:hypothetical protein BX600DRAFT_544500 [Xylariales sp. PMI_506]|nr:hypothetical protein BX600DRAFT_544500 [Xylariales sp. PMI_506]